MTTWAKAGRLPGWLVGVCTVAAVAQPPNDNCANAVAFDLLPGVPFTYSGDNTGATVDCEWLPPSCPLPEVWFRFTTYETLRVTIDYCGTNPPFANWYTFMNRSCPCELAGWVHADNFFRSCADDNFELDWLDLPPGTYYWPLLSSAEYGAEGPYTVTFKAMIPPPPEVCPVGALFGQVPMDEGGHWNAYVSGVGPGFEYQVFENFWGVTQRIGALEWWGLPFVYADGTWQFCSNPTNMSFEVSFYTDIANAPGTLVWQQVLTPTITEAVPYAGMTLYRYEVPALDPCVNLSAGWFSVKSLLTPEGCVFLWPVSPDGDFNSYQGTEQLTTNFAFCLLPGDCPDIFGACCNDQDGTCLDNVEWDNCGVPLRFTPNALCAGLDPACGIGACCVAGVNCQLDGTESQCAALGGEWFPGESCADFACPGCQHRVELWDCYGDGWNGCTLDVKVNGVVVLNHITLANGHGPAVFYFPAGPGDTIQTIYHPLYYPNEPYYFIYDGYGSLLGSDGIVNGDCHYTPTGITVYGWCDAPALGACCLPGFVCQVQTLEECLAIGGLYQGYNTTCDSNPCQAAGGACCFSDGSCQFLYEYECAGAHGQFAGILQTCNPNPCEPYYCPAGADMCSVYIETVQIAGIYNESGCDGVDQYEDFTALGPAAVPRGVVTALTVMTGWDQTDFTCSAWIDYNHDLLFDDNFESLGDVPAGSYLYVFHFTPPTWALSGPTRLRIRLDRVNPDPEPCGFRPTGEVEDYTVSVIGPVGDMNCDGSVDFADINPFVLFLSNFALWQETYAGCPPQNGDINGDGSYPSFDDINPFVALLTGS